MSKVTRHNWREYCEEPELTDEEHKERAALSREIVADMFENANALFLFIEECTQTEQAAYEGRKLPTSWTGYPAYVDIVRKRDRAELAAWREWQEREDGDE